MTRRSLFGFLGALPFVGPLIAKAVEVPPQELVGRIEVLSGEPVPLDAFQRSTSGLVVYDLNRCCVWTASEGTWELVATDEERVRAALGDFVR